MSEITVELPDELVSHVNLQAKNREESVSDYIKRLVLIDLMEDKLAILKYKPMIDRF